MIHPLPPNSAETERNSALALSNCVHLYEGVRHRDKYLPTDSAVYSRCRMYRTYCMCPPNQSVMHALIVGHEDDFGSLLAGFRCVLRIFTGWFGVKLLQLIVCAGVHCVGTTCRSDKNDMALIKLRVDQTLQWLGGCQCLGGLCMLEPHARLPTLLSG